MKNEKNWQLKISPDEKRKELAFEVSPDEKDKPRFWQFVDRKPN